MSTREPGDRAPERGVRVDAPTTGSAQLPAPSAWLTYEPFYGLHEQPFSLTSNPAFFHHGEAHAATFQSLLAGIRRRERLSVLTGDIGTGKTTLCRAVLQDLDRETFSAFVADPFASREDLLKVLLMEFGVMSLEDLTSGRLKTASRTELSYLLSDFLGKLAPLQAFAVVIIDEAQNLSLPLLEELRILSDFDGRDRQLQVVLVGQLELRHKLKLAEMRQVDQRVSVRCHLEPLNRSDVAAYVAHRLRVAGGAPDRVGFSSEACDAVYRASQGVPRVINRICDRALHHGHVVRAAIIDRTLVEAATRELDDRSSDLMPGSTRVDAVDAGVAGSPADSPRAESSAPAQHQDAIPAAERPRPSPATVRARPAVSVSRTAADRHRHSRPTLRLNAWRPARIAFAVMLLLGALTLGLSAVETVWEDSEQVGPLPSLPEERLPPPAAAFRPPTHPETLHQAPAVAGSCTIEVALFETRQAVSWLIEDLATAGFRAYEEQVDLPNRGVHYLVSIGPFATWVGAQPELQRLRQARRDDGARVRCN